MTCAKYLVHVATRSVGGAGKFSHVTGNGEIFRSLDATDESEASDLDATETLAPVGQPVGLRVRPTPHLSKLNELFRNRKLPSVDRGRVASALQRYGEWVSQMTRIDLSGEARVQALAEATNDYKRFVELELIWDSEADFLFRQRGQLKLDNSIIEEFLPWLVDPAILPELRDVDCHAGPAKAFAAVYFASVLNGPSPFTGVRVRTKDQDFTLSRRAHIRASFSTDFAPGETESTSVWLAYLAAECKTNLDKTMFQEATATAHDLKVALPGARYYLVCEYLDMTPISTAGTDIDEVLILRGKRLASNKRVEYSSAANRVRLRDEYADFLVRNPIRADVLVRFVDHLRALLTHADPNENDVVERGYF